MKPNIPSVFLLTTFLISFASCKRFKDERSVVSNPLIGKWRLDSIDIGKDTSFAMMLTLIAMQQDPEGLYFEFTRDKIFTYSKNDIDTMLYWFEIATQSFFTNESGRRHSSCYNHLNDSISSITITKNEKFFIKKR